MAIRDRNISKTANVGRECVQLALGTTATTQTGKRTDAVTIPYAFTILSAELYGLTVTATISSKVRVGTTDVVAATTPVADTPTNAPITAAGPYASGTVLNAVYTTDGTGATTNGYWSVWIRPHGMEDEVKQTA